MKLVCISDPHGHLPEVPECDFLIVAGDITPAYDHSVKFQASWLNTTFRKWLDHVPARHVVGIAGNHDFVFEQAPHLVPTDLRWHYLNCSGVKINGIRFWGCPWTPWFWNWAFNAPERNGEDFLAEKYRWMSSKVDIVLSHGPPFGYGDLVPPDLKASPNHGEHVGSTALLARLKRNRPLLCCFGHIHSGHGVYELQDDKSTIVLANASVVNERYVVTNKPIEFKITESAITDERKWQITQTQ